MFVFVIVIMVINIIEQLPLPCPILRLLLKYVLIMPYQICFLDCHDIIQIFCRRFQEDCSYYLPFHQPVVNIQNSSSPGGHFWKLLTKKSLKKMLFESTNLANLTRNGFRWSSPYSCICWQWGADKGRSYMLRDSPWSSW